jgi:single-strand DNA-binding protein
MGRFINKVMLIGNVGNDPDIRTTSSGTQVAKVSLATSHQWKDSSGQQKEKTEWHRLTFFGRVVDIVEQWVKKGDRLYVEGRLEYSESETDGQKRYWTDIIVADMSLLGSTGAEGQGGGGRGGGFQGHSSPAAGGQGGGGRGGGFQGDSSPAADPPPISETDDDLPF